MNERCFDSSEDEYDKTVTTLGRFADILADESADYATIRSGLISYVRDEFRLRDEVAQWAVTSKQAMAESFPTSADFRADPEFARYNIKQSFYDWVVPTYEALYDAKATDVWLPVAWEMLLGDNDAALRGYVAEDIERRCRLDDVSAYALCDQLQRYEEVSLRRLSLAVDYNMIVDNQAFLMQQLLASRIYVARPQNTV